MFCKVPLRHRVGLLYIMCNRAWLHLIYKRLDSIAKWNLGNMYVLCEWPEDLEPRGDLKDCVTLNLCAPGVVRHGCAKAIVC